MPARAGRPLCAGRCAGGGAGRYTGFVAGRRDRPAAARLVPVAGEDGVSTQLSPRRVSTTRISSTNPADRGRGAAARTTCSNDRNTRAGCHDRNQNVLGSRARRRRDLRARPGKSSWPRLKRSSPQSGAPFPSAAAAPGRLGAAGGYLAAGAPDLPKPPAHLRWPSVCVFRDPPRAGRTVGGAGLLRRGR